MSQRILEPLNPDTALEDRSVWKEINRKLLYSQSQELVKNHVAGRRCYTKLPNTSENDSYPLSLEVERSLADDFAFIAAIEPQVDFVSAVAIEQNQESLIFTLAANEGISTTVKEHFNELFEILRKHGRKGISQSDCKEQLFENIVRVNRNRILGRLGSRWFEPPAHLANALRPSPLPGRLRKLFTQVQRASTHREVQGFELLAYQISNFEKAFRKLEGGASDEIIANIQGAIKQAYALTEDGVNFPERLKALGCPDRLLDTRDVREVGKVSNYWRISHHLAICSRRFRSQFENAVWCPISNFKASSKPEVLPRRFVHAEIQVLAYYEINPHSLPPRVIGVSKEACFLCDSFIRAHGRFSISGAHRQMVAGWTVPDLEDYSSQSVTRVRTALSRVCEEVQQEFLRSRKEHSWRPFPLQSAINLNTVHLVTPSNSTLLSRDHRRNGDDTDDTEFSRPTANSRHVVVREDAHTVSASNNKIPSIAGYQNGAGGKQQWESSLPVDVAIEDPAPDYMRWLDFSATCSISPAIELSAQMPKLFTAGSVSLGPVSVSDHKRIVHLADIPLEGELTIERGLCDAPNELSFVLVGEPNQEIQVRCQWHSC